MARLTALRYVLPTATGCSSFERAFFVYLEVSIWVEIEFAYDGCLVERSSETNDTIGELILYEGKVNTFAITKVSFCFLHPASLATTNFEIHRVVTLYRSKG